MLSKCKSVPMAIVLLSVAHAVTDLSMGGLLVALPYLKAKFALTYAQTSAIILIQNLTSSTIQPLFGYISDRTPRPWMMLAGCLFAGIALLGVLFAQNYFLLLVYTVINGLGIAIFHPEAAKTANRLSGAAKGRGVSFFIVGGNAGFALGSIFLAALLVHGGGEKLLWFIAPNLIIMIPLYKLVAKLTVENTQKTAIIPSKINIPLTLPLLALLGVVLVRATVSAGISAFIPLYYVSFLHGNELYASSLLSTGLAAGAIGTLFGGILSDRYGSKLVMLYSILPTTLMLYLFQMATGIWVFVTIGAACALLSASFSSSLVLMQRMMPNNIGMASGLTIGFSVGLGGMGVLALGRVADLWSLPIVFDILALLPVIGFFVTLFIKDAVERKPALV